MLSLAAIRRVPALSALPRRCYTSSAKEGSVAQSKGFSKKEQAQENQYAHQREQEEIAKLRKQLLKELETDGAPEDKIARAQKVLKDSEAAEKK